MNVHLRLLNLSACFIFGLFPFAVPAGQPVVELKVMSFNIWVSGGRSLSNCIAAIRTSGADVVGLQECRSDTVPIIASQLGFHATSHSGIPIISRYPIVSTLSVSGGSGVTVELSPGQRIHFFNCHLTAYPYGPYTLQEGGSRAAILAQEDSTRMPALKSLLAGMKPYLESATPCFLTGDFNAPSHHDYTDFPWPTSLACVQAGLLDTYFAAHPGNRKFPGRFAFNDPGVTWTPIIETEPNGVFDRIDFVHASDGDGLTVLGSEVLDERNSIKPWPSDHRAVLTRVRLPSPKPQKQASHPVPATGVSGISPAVSLCWLEGEGATKHRVHFGTNTPLPLLVETSGNQIPLPKLGPQTRYFWRVDALGPQGWVEGVLWDFTVRDYRTHEWRLDSVSLPALAGEARLESADGEGTAGLLRIVQTGGDSLPDPHGATSAAVLRVPALVQKSNGLHVHLAGSGPNGGGRYINQYTLVWDLLIPAPLGRTALLNTNPSNANDADLYVLSNGRVGSVALGFSDPGLFKSNRWHRLALVADLAASQVRVHLDGTRFLSASSPLDGTYSLFSGQDPGADFLLFNEGDSAGVHTHELYLMSFLASDRTWAEDELVKLGGVQADGIAAIDPPLLLQAQQRAGDILLGWAGGRSPYRLQYSDSLLEGWRNLLDHTFASAHQVPLSGAKAFFRIIGAR